jgi:hypothetical protein
LLLVDQVRVAVLVDHDVKRQQQMALEVRDGASELADEAADRREHLHPSVAAVGPRRGRECRIGS